MSNNTGQLTGTESGQGAGGQYHNIPGITTGMRILQDAVHIVRDFNQATLDFEAFIPSALLGVDLLLNNHINLLSALDNNSSSVERRVEAIERRFTALENPQGVPRADNPNLNRGLELSE